MKRTAVLGIFILLALTCSLARGDEPGSLQQKTGAFPFTRIDTSFISQGTRCAAWLYLPRGITRPPLVVLAHGFGGERSFKLAAYAERFTSQGMACLVFDYRCFGDSEGEPRNYISPSRHLEDWQAAIAFAGTLGSVDSTRMALWGTSFSGGHVIVTAAQTPGISAIVAQVPFVDGRASTRSSWFKVQAVYHGLLDAAGSALFNRRHYVPIVGDPDSFAMLNTPDALEGAKKLLPPGAKPGRKCPAVIGITGAFYRPIDYAPRVTCPALIIYAKQDTLIPPQLVRKAAEGMQKATVIGLDMKHFDVYEGEPFEKAVGLEADFLKAQLMTDAGSRQRETPGE